MESIDYLLSSITLDKKSVENIFSENHKDMTFIDIAGKHKSNEAAIFILDWCMSNFPKLASVFADHNEKGATKENKVINDGPTSTKTYESKKIGYKELNKREEKFARTYYWASYYGQLDYVKKFMSTLGFSPFMKTYRH